MPVSKKQANETVVAHRTDSGKSTLICEPYWRSGCGRATIYVGDCREIMAKMDRDQFHAVVTDPPYGLGREPDVVEVMRSWIKCGYHEVTGGGFMGKQWDAFVPQPATWQECVRVMRPGAHMLCFAGTRTLDWMTMALRFVAMEIRDLVMYCYGSGFPKGNNVDKAIDRELGAKRKQTRTPMSPDGNVWMDKIGADRPWKEKAKEVGYHEHDSDEPVTEQARQWQGWNTSLKPALEPIILARRPFHMTVAQCAMENGTGALNVGACLVGTTGGTVSVGEPNHLNQVYGNDMGGLGIVDAGKGRWPANLCHDGSDEVVDLFPESKSSSAVMPLPSTPGQVYGVDHGNTSHAPTRRGHDDEGSAARFFYTAKADDDDRPHGKGKHVTTHPTVKPLDLMQYLVRLVCVRGGTVLDPFMGTGSTGCAAVLEGMRFVGVELSEEYADLAVGKIKLALAQLRPEDSPGLPATVRPAAATAPAPKKLRGT